MFTFLGMWLRRTGSRLFVLCMLLQPVWSSQSSFILFSNTTHILKLLPNSSTTTPLIFNLVNAVALDVDVKAGHVYWSDVIEKSIKRANIDGSNVIEIVNSSIGVCDGLAVEWLSRKLYWIDYTYKFIQVSELDGSQRRILVDTGLGKPRGIAVYPQADLMFWTDRGSTPRIERSSLSGSSRVDIVTDKIKTPGQISIDYSTNQIYWVDSFYDWLQTTDMDGHSRKTIFQQSDIQPFGVSVLHNTLYWTDWVSRGIHVSNSKTKKVVKSLYNVGRFPMGVAVYDESRQPPGFNKCSNNNGNCSYLCLASSNGRHCACPSGRQLTSDEKACIEVSRSFMLVADAGSPAVYKINVDLPNHNRILLSVNETTAVTYDPADDRIYWIDGQQRSIRRVFLNMTGEEAFNAHSVRPETLAVDWVGRLLYWTDAWTRRIEAARLDNGLQTSVIISGLEKPRGLVLDPPKGQMYWTDWGFKPKIEVSNMDGTSRWTLEDSDLKWPNALTIDTTEGRLYWADAGRDRIESRDTDGAQPKRLELKGSNIQTFSLAFFKGHVFWSDMKTKSVQKFSVRTGVSLSYVKSLTRPIGVFIYDPSSYPEVSTLCSKSQAGCSHICLIRHLGYTCACPSGYKLRDDKKTCERAQQFILFVDGGAPSVNILPQDINSLWTPIAILSTKSQPSDFDYDPVSDSFFWTDLATSSVNSYSITNKQFMSLHRCNVERPMGIAVDWVGGNLYWTDTWKGVVEVSRTDGSMRRVLFEKRHVTSIVLDLKKGRMFLSVCGPSPKIIKLFMDGSFNMTLVSQGLKCPTSLTFDQKSQRLFWIDIPRKKVESVMTNNANREVLYLDQRASPVGFTLNGDYAYITDANIGRIYRIGLHNRKNTTLASALKKPTTIRFYDKTQMMNVSKKCLVNNGGCSDLCLLSASRNVKCACSTGGKLLKDDKTCHHEPFVGQMNKRFLLIADMNYQDIFRVPLNNKESFCESIYESKVINSESPRTKPISITYNPRDQLLYWTDENTRAVMRGTKDGRNIEIVASRGVLYPDGIDVDFISQNVYWTDVMRKRIEVSRLDGSDRKMLIGWSLDKPGAIVVDPIAGNMYWTDYGWSPKIEKAHMDGTSRKTIIGVGLKRPTGLALDFRLRRLYWSDEGTGKIESIRLDGSNRRTEYSASKKTDQGKRAPFGLAFQSGKLYWADVKTRSIYELEVATGALSVVANGLARPVDVRVVGNMDMDIDTNECSKRNGGCSNLCLPVPALPGFKCACPEGVNLKTDDDKTCDGVNRCTEISGLDHGKVDERCRNIPGGECTVTCDTGYKLIGENRMHCHGNGSWDASIPKCEVITCFPPLKPKYGRFNSTECNNETQPVRYGVTCTYVCGTLDGFVRQGPSSTRCQANGMWTMSRIPTSCKDNQAPVIICPGDIDRVTDPGLSTALINWTSPKTSDNEDSNPVVSVSPSGLKLPHNFKAGRHVIRYVSTDSAGLTGSCTFHVTVHDKEPPKVVQCKKNFTFITKQAISLVSFSGINFSDNVGVAKVDFENVSKLAWGTHYLTVRALDAAGNAAECNINVLVYSERCRIAAPLNGYKVCKTWRGGGIFCSIDCKKGYAFTQDKQKFYMCSHSEGWRNANDYADGRLRLPDCSKTIGFTEMSISGELRYDATRCLQEALFTSIQNKISQILKKYFVATLSICVDKGTCNLAGISISCTNKFQKRVIRTDYYNKQMNAKFDIRVFLSSEGTKDVINKTRHEIQSLVSDGINISDIELIIEGYALSFDPRTGLTVDEIRGICAVGQVYKDDQCINCPIGHYYNVTTDNCERCPVDTYQAGEGQLACIQCKTGLSTLGLEGAWVDTQCRECADFERTEIKKCEKWRRAGKCSNDKPTMFDMCPRHCRFCAVQEIVSKPKKRRRQGVNLKAVIPALVVPSVILISIVLLVVILLRRKRRRREDKNNLSIDPIMKKKLSLDGHNRNKYRNAIQVQQLHVRFHEGKKIKKRDKNKSRTSAIKAVLKREKKNDDEDIYVRIPHKKTALNDKKPRKKKENRKISSGESEQVPTSLELQEISAQMDAAQV